jgi:hypothetical protein
LTPGDERPASLLAWLVPSIGASVFLLGVGLVLFGKTLFSYDGDVGRHVRIGLDILTTHHIPTVDQYSHSMAGEHFVPYEWLSETLFASSWSAAGLPGVALLTALLFATSAWLVYRTARLPGPGPLLAGAVTVLALVLQAGHLLPRPHLFTTLLAVTFLFLLESYQRSGRRGYLFVLPPLMLAWVNLHGGFLVGFILLGVYVLDAWRTRASSPARLLALLAASVACALATFVSPAGSEIWSHTTGYLRIDLLVDMTHEYRSPDFHGGYGRAFLLAILTGFSLLAGGRAKPSFRETLLFIGWLAAALHSARNIPLFGVLAVPWYASWIQRTCEALTAGGRHGLADRIQRLDGSAARTEALLRPAVVSISGLVAMAALALGPWSERYRFDETFFPVVALDKLPEDPARGHVFNEMAWGGYILLQRPDIPVFIDGQTDFYGERLSSDYLRIIGGGRGWNELLDSYAIDWTLTRPDEPIVQLLDLHPDWEIRYRDPVAALSSRRRSAAAGEELQ